MIPSLLIPTCRPLLRMALCFGMGVFLTAAPAQEEKEGLALPELKARFDEALARLDQPISRLNLSYLEALKRQMTVETTKANLKGALEVKEEIDRIGDGSSYDWAAMREESTDPPAVAQMKKKYMIERNRLWKAGKRSRDDLVTSYLAALGQKEKVLTKLGKIPEALEVRRTHDAIAEDPRMSRGAISDPDPHSFTGKIHLVAKGEVELSHQGAPLSYRNASPDKDKYVDGTSPEILISAGDVILVRMRSTVVYRSFILALESIDGRRAIPVGVADLRYLGSDLAKRPDESLVKKATEGPDRGTPDADMSALWAGKTLSEISKKGSEWVKSGPGGMWHTYAIVIEPKMIQSPAGN